MEDYLKGAENQHRSASVKGKVVTMNHVTKFDNGEQKYMKTVVDLSGETDEDIYLNAATNYLIQVLRPRAIKPNKPSEIKEDVAMRPCDYPASKGGGKVDPKVAAQRAAVKMSPEARAELILELQKMNKEEKK